MEAGTPSTVASTNGDTGEYLIYETIVARVGSRPTWFKHCLYNILFDLEKTKTLETFLMKTAEAMEKMRRIEGRVATDQVCSRTHRYDLDT